MSGYSRRYYLRSLPDCTVRVRRDSFGTTLAAVVPCKFAAWEERSRNAVTRCSPVACSRDGECGHRRAQKEQRRCAVFGWCSYR